MPRNMSSVYVNHIDINGFVVFSSVHGVILGEPLIKDIPEGESPTLS